MVFHLVSLMLFRRIVVEGIAVCLNGKHRFLADAVDDEEIDMGVIVAGVCQFLLRHKGCVLDNLSERYVAKHFKAGETVVRGEYVVDEMIGHVL